jgi:hypothetical protein
LLADKPFQRREPRFILLKTIRRGRVFVKGAGLVLLNPDPDQVSTDVVALGEPMQGLAGQEFLNDLALEFDAVRAVLGHGLRAFESPARWSILAAPTVRPTGPLQVQGELWNALTKRSAPVVGLGAWLRAVQSSSVSITVRTRVVTEGSAGSDDISSISGS